MALVLRSTLGNISDEKQNPSTRMEGNLHNDGKEYIYRKEGKNTAVHVGKRVHI